MRTLFFICLLLLFGNSLMAQLYFPPVNSNEWETTDPSDLGWCPDEINALYDFLETNNSKAFILLKDGKIVLEEYFNGHTATDTWYWASAGKTLTAFTVGIAQQENLLNIGDPTSDYLGTGWTNATPSQEANITVRDQLSMTTGLDDGVTDPNCIDPSCLQYLADAGERWAYHNAPYTLLTNVVENATGQTMNQYITEKIKTPTGMDGLFLPLGDLEVFFSTARSMARFGLLVLNEGSWEGTPILTDSAYFNEMVNTSQDLNEAYGYLWWLNGKDTYMIPQSQIVFNGPFVPNAPDDMISGMGKDGQFVNVIPSRNMVWIRMGEDPGNLPVPYLLNDAIWEYLNQLDCSLSTPVVETPAKISVYPNPVTETLYLKNPFQQDYSYVLYTVAGQQILEGNSDKVDVSELKGGMYFLKVIYGNTSETIKIIKR